MKKHQRQPSHEVSTMTPPISGPATVATAKTAPKMPAYRPSSRGGIIAAITICTSAVRPPAPRPWTTRAMISVVVSWEEPASSEPATNRPRESCTSSFWLNRSASLPHSGTEVVIASSSAVTTQV
jgi:hypothetical protein